MFIRMFGLFLLYGVVCVCLGTIVKTDEDDTNSNLDHINEGLKEYGAEITPIEDSSDNNLESKEREESKVTEGIRRQILGAENLIPYPGPLSMNHVLEKPIFNHQIHYVPKPFPVMSVQYIPKPVPVPVAVPPSYHVSHIHLHHNYHLNPCQDGGIWVKMAHGYFCICPKEFRGKHCEARNYCSSNPCLNGATCVEISGAFKCVCPSGFLGVVCEERNPCHPNPCRNGGTCTRSDTEQGFVCVCKEGFKGDHCEGFNRCDPNPCKNSGTCQQLKGDSYQCICSPPYKGTLCTDPKQCFVNPCMNGGTCHENEAGYTCSCRIGYTGANCETHVCHPNPCLHGGKCEVESGHYKCVCLPLYKGYMCEIPHPCYTLPCQNNGVCIDSYSGYSSYPDHWDSHGYLHYLCLCHTGFLGPNCEDDVCKRCDTNAKCLNNTCICIEGFYGDGFHCKKIPHPCHPNPCKNNGVCKELQGGEYDCKCPSGTTGKHCEDKDPCIPNPCQNNGKCISGTDGTTKCVCENGRTGPNCELTIDPCESNPCQNGGTCQNENGKAVCKCAGKYMGPTCKECGCPKGNKLAIPPESSQKCDAYGECMCEGSLTKTETGCKVGKSSTGCDNKPCKNGGTCTAKGPSAFTCKCPPEWKGPTCEIPVCTSGYCLNNGICQPRNGEPFCICQPGFSGPRCENKPIPKVVNPCHPNPCLNGGSCVPVGGSYDCRCDIQYTGAHCEVDKCAKCDVHAICIHGHCKCKAGYIGTGYECMKVHQKHCPVACPVYSTCTNGACQCVPGYTMTGDHCTPLPVPCPVYSTCTNGACQCVPGYTMTGDHCTRISVYGILDGNDEGEGEEEEETPATAPTPPPPTTLPITGVPTVTQATVTQPPATPVPSTAPITKPPIIPVTAPKTTPSTTPVLSTAPNTTPAAPVTTAPGGAPGGSPGVTLPPGVGPPAAAPAIPVPPSVAGSLPAGAPALADEAAFQYADQSPYSRQPYVAPVPSPLPVPASPMMYYYNYPYPSPVTAEAPATRYHGNLSPAAYRYPVPQYYKYSSYPDYYRRLKGYGR